MCEQEGAENWDSEWKPMGKQIMLKSSVVPGQTHPGRTGTDCSFSTYPFKRFYSERKGEGEKDNSFSCLFEVPQSLMNFSFEVFCFQKTKISQQTKGFFWKTSLVIWASLFQMACTFLKLRFPNLTCIGTSSIQQS